MFNSMHYGNLFQLVGGSLKCVHKWRIYQQQKTKQKQRPVHALFQCENDWAIMGNK